MNKNNCPKCGAEFELGTKFCQKCGCNLANEFIENPICPKCNKKFPAGTKFCDADGAKLVSPDKLIPKCVKCGQVYTDGTKFCSHDGGQVIAEALRGSSANADITDDISRYADIITDKYFSGVEKWHGIVTFWAIFALAVNAITAIYNLVRYIDYFSYLPSLIIVVICGFVNVLAIILLLKRKKVGFFVLAGSALIVLICHLGMGTGSKAVFGVLAIGVWYAILQIKRDGVTAWNTLK
jgi:hypothetical protein